MLNISADIEFEFFHQIVKYSRWRDAMAIEIVALENNNTWTVTCLPPGKYLIGCKWNYRIKYHADSSIK